MLGAENMLVNFLIWRCNGWNSSFEGIVLVVFFGGSGESDLEGDRCWPPCWQKHIFSGQTGHNE